MKRITLFCLMLPAAAFGDDPFACVDPDFADAFLGNAYFGRPTYSTDVPAALTGLQVPSLWPSMLRNDVLRATSQTRKV